MISIGLLGAGNVAHILALHQTGFRIAAVYDRHEDRRNRIAAETECLSCTTFDELLALDFSLLVEVASIEAVQQYGLRVLDQGKDLVVLSAGGLLDKAFRQTLIRQAGALGCTIRVPSGALFGLDNMKIGRISSFDRLELRTTKPSRALNLDVLERTCLFKGTAEECVRQYPRNINVAATLALASDHDVFVELWVDPEAQCNKHEIFVSGDFGEMKTSVCNIPSPDNPSTSYLAALSIMTLLGELQQPLIVGT